jgi:hypothetical protein
MLWSLPAAVESNIEKLTEKWRMAWHRVTCYGELKPRLLELCSRLKLKFVEEA